MNQELPPLTSYSEELRQNAMDKYQVIAPYLKHEESLSNIAEESGVPKRTLYHWVNQYQQTLIYQQWAVLFDTLPHRYKCCDIIA